MVVAALIVAFWPVWLWYCERMLDPSDPSWGAVSLLLLISVLVKRASDKSSGDLRLPLAGLVIYIVTFSIVPPLIRASVAVFVLVSWASGRMFGDTLRLSLLGLGLLSLPVLASFQFYFGYPLRLVVSNASSLLLRAAGLNVHTEGAGLVWMGRSVMVDAPCSGVNMLWASLLFVCGLAAIKNTGNRQTVVLVSLTLVATVMANILRASSLFYLEADIVSAPSWAHSFLGLVCFGLLVFSVAHLCSRIPVSPLAVVLPADPVEKNSMSAGKCLLLACGVAALIPFSIFEAEPVDQNGFPGWPDKFEGRSLTRLALSAEEEGFYKTGFPGKVARFSDGKREVVIRWVTRPTRSLHPSQDCFRGSGYTVVEESLKSDRREFRVKKESEELLVSEYITDGRGNVWTDISAWYWDAVLGRSEGPYWSYVVGRKKRP